MNNFWTGFTKQADAKRTMGELIENIAYGLASRAGKDGMPLAEQLIDNFYSKQKADAFMHWKDVPAKDALKTLKTMTKQTKADPAKAFELLEFLGGAWKNSGKVS